MLCVCPQLGQQLFPVYRGCATPDNIGFQPRFGEEGGGFSCNAHKFTSVEEFEQGPCSW